MSLTFKRYYWLRIVLVLFTVGLMMIGSKRIFSYNFGQAINPTATVTQASNDVINTIATFDDSVVHDITIDMSDALYQQMLDTYTETSEKDYFAVNVTIDGVTINNVGVRLKGNSSLRWLGGGMGGGQNGGSMPGGMGGARGQFTGGAMNQGRQAMQGQVGSGQTQGFNPMMGTGNQGGFGGGGMGGGMSQSNTGYLPLMLKFDEFIEGQSYNGATELSLRVGGFSDTTLLAEMLGYRVYQDLDLPAPDTAYTKVTIGGLDSQLYVLSEIINADYVDSYYPDDDGILYKSSDFYDFSYYGEDPTLYSEVFSQKTNENKDDMSQLISLIKFVNTSSDEEFDAQLEDYIDVDSVLYLMAIDSIIQNSDGFNNGRSNYYFYYDKEEKKMRILTWDQNLAFGGFGGGGGGMNRRGITGTGVQQMMGTGSNGMSGSISNTTLTAPGENVGSGGQFTGGAMNQERQQMQGQTGSGQNQGFNPMMGSGFVGGGVGGGMGGMGNGTNIFKNRLLQSEKFAQRYEEIFDIVYDMTYTQGTLAYNLEYLSQVFLAWNESEQLISSQTYESSLASLQQTIANRKSATAQSDIAAAQTTTGSVVR